MASGVATTVVNTVVMVVGYPIYLHFLGYEKYGVWLVLATVLTFVQLGNLGIGPAVMKLVAEEYGRGDIEAVQRYITAALALLCISGTVALIVILTFKSQIITPFKLSDENAKTVLWLLPYIGVLSIYVFVVQVFEVALSGLARMDLTNYIQSAGRIATVIVTAVLLYSGRGIESMLIASIASYLLIHIASIICIWRIAPIRFWQINRLDTQHCKRLLQIGGGVFGSSLLGMLVSPFNKLMLSRYAGVDTIPIYELAFQGACMFRSFFDSVIRAIMPEISRLYGEYTEHTRERIKSLKQRSMKIIWLFGLPLYGALMLVAEPLLKVCLRQEYLEPIPNALRVMLIATFISLLAVPAHYTIMGLGRVRYFVIAGIIGAGANFVLVTAYCITTGHISVFIMGLFLIVTFVMSTTYLISRANHSLAWNSL